MASGGYLPVSCRDMYYAVRPLIMGIAAKELSYKYWGDLLADYTTAHPSALPLLCYDPRGLLVEPHTAATVPLGTREVAGYAAPYWLYDKILYVEKKGLREAFDAVQLAERYDMAICYGQGFAPEAARALLSRLQQDRDYQLFVLHDADVEGYLIADTLAAETTRMPNHRIAVVDLGLTVAQALAHGLAVEERERTDALPDRLTLTDDELAWFTRVPLPGRRKPTWKTKRVELNAFTVPARIAFVEQRLAAVGAHTKILPPQEVLAKQAQAEHRRQITQLVDDLLLEMCGRDAIVDELVDVVPLPQDRLAATVTDAQDQTQRWTTALARRQAAELAGDHHRICGRVQERVAAQLADALGGAA